MSYTVKCKMNQQECSVIVFKLEHLGAIYKSLQSKGATDITVSTPKPSEQLLLKQAIESMGLKEQLDLIEQFKHYIKMIS